MRLRRDTIKSNDFMCRCSKRQEARCNRVLAHARKLVTNRAAITDDLDFVNRLLYTLVLDGDLGIFADQWAGVSWKHQKSVKGADGKWGVEDGPSCFIQCDSIVDGLAAAVVFANQERAS